MSAYTSLSTVSPPPAQYESSSSAMRMNSWPMSSQAILLLEETLVLLPSSTSMNSISPRRMPLRPSSSKPARLITGMSIKTMKSMDIDTWSTTTLGSMAITPSRSGKPPGKKKITSMEPLPRYSLQINLKPTIFLC